MTKCLLPGATLGVLGSGQLGRMFTIAARRLGYRVHVLSPDTETPAGQVADVETCAAYDDMDAVQSFVRSVDAVTFEFENVPAATAELAARFVPVRPDGRILHITQDRAREKSFLQRAGFPTAPFAFVSSEMELSEALRAIGSPAVMKTAGFGYDGKGQAVIKSPAGAPDVWNSFNQSDVVLERFIDFDCELSVIVARGTDGALVDYGPFENSHHQHILDISTGPAGLPHAIRDAAIDMARAVAMELDLVGVLCVEMFLTRDGQLLINELAPRPHNSGHLTIDAHVTCQFEQQVRALCGLPLGSSRQHCPAAMANLLGDLWQSHEPQWDQVAACPNVKIHLYGKQHARPGRKMGHLTALADSTELASATVRQSREALAARSAN